MKRWIVRVVVPAVFLLVVFGNLNFAPSGWCAGEDRFWKGHLEAIRIREFVFTEAPFASCHASSLVEGPKGLLCAWFGGTREGAADVCIWLSRWENGRWSSPQLVADGIQPDGSRYPCWNPVLFRPRASNTIYLFYKVGPSPSRWWGMVKVSEDGGETWGPARRLPEGILGPIKNKPLELPDGTWVCPSSTETPERPSRWQVHFELTRDQGTTWEKVEVPSGAVELNAIQPTIFQLQDGQLVAMGRTRENRVFWTFSFDQGRTWVPLQRSLLPNPNAGLDGITLRDGRHLLVYNHTLRGRSPLNVALSDDTWQWRPALVLEDEPGEYSYPAVIQTSDGLVHVSYTWKRQRIAHVVIDPEKLVALPHLLGPWPLEGEVPKPSASGALTPPGSSPARPNIVLVITDDQGPGDFSCFGNPILRTPHLDRLFSESVLLTDFHVTPVCTPTRGQLLTGQDALRNGARTVPAGSNMIWPEIVTLPQVLRAAGYATGLFGKWHLGDHYPNRPMDRGFEKAIWHGGWGIASDVEFDNDTVNIRYLDGPEVRHSKRYCTDLWFEEAIAWMEDCHREGRPFFCYLAPNAPHSPFWAQPKDAAPYANKTKPEIAEFFGMISNIDENIGRLEDFLFSSGLKENTVVIFLTDNGGTAGVPVFNAGLRGSKGGYYEGGHRVPCAIRWPAGGIGGGKVLSEPTQVQDLFPTLLELCGLPVPQGHNFDGISLAEALRNPAAAKLPDRILVVQYGRRTGAVQYDGCVIWGPWRLVNGKELYRVDEDRAQKRDLASKHPEVVSRLREYYEQWWTKILPRVYEYQPIPVGTEFENPVILSSNYWAGVDVDNNQRVAAAEGGPQGGVFHVLVTRPGRYTVELRRWPFHTLEAIGSAGPMFTVSGRPLSLDPKGPLAAEQKQRPGAWGVIPERRIIPAHKAILKVGERFYTAPITPDALGAVFQLELPAGETTLQGWFQDRDGQDLCGAFYVMVRFEGN
jgi:arylsulfatase A-like enzyme/predicted neuraminidase